MKKPVCVKGDLLDSNAKYIAHQCNCVTSRAAHLAKDVFDRFPWADIYTDRAKYDREELPLPNEQPGDIVIRGNGNDERYVINILGQYYPGMVSYPNSSKDNYEARQKYFEKALCKIVKVEDLESIAFPYKIGCGAAGGDWAVYKGLIELFATKTGADVYIVRLEGV